MSKFEKGKKYVFTDRQFNIGRDTSNRLTFIVPDESTGGEHRIVAYDFQNQRMPEKITCYFNGIRLEQDPFSVAPLLYKPGEIHKFYVNSDVRGGRCTLRDEINNVTYKNIYIGRAPFKRFDRITCMIDEVDGDTLKVTAVTDNKKRDEAFVPDDLSELPEGRYLRGGVLKKLLEMPEYAETRKLVEEEDNSWVISFLETSLRLTVDMLRGRITPKGYILRGLESLAVALIERSDYVLTLPKREQYDSQQKLDDIARNAGDLWRAYNLMVSREADNTMLAILGSLEKSRRFYKPNEKVRLLSAMIQIEAVNVDIYMDRILGIISTHHTNNAFMTYFKAGMQEVLRGFILRREVALAHSDRDSLRLLLRALAMEQLLDVGSSTPEVVARRGFMYVCAAMLVNSCDNALPAKAIQCFAGLVNGPLEFSWNDLSDISRLCYASLTRPFAQSDLIPTTSIYRGTDWTLSVTHGTLTLSSADNIENLKKSLSYSLFPGIMADVLTEEKISGLSSVCDENPVIQAPKMKELARMLMANWNSGARQQMSPAAQLRLEKGDSVKIFITGQRDNGFFECRIADSYYLGSGIISVHDMVPYEVRPVLTDFMKDGRPLLFEATVGEVLDDGTYLFSLRRAISSHNVQEAAYDRDSETEVPGIITGIYKSPLGYFALSNEGYPMVVWLPSNANFQLHRNDIVVARVLMVNSENNNLFVKSEFLDLLNPQEITPDSGIRKDVQEIFRHTLLNVSNGETYDGEMPVAGESEDYPEITLSTANAILIARVISIMSAIEGTELGTAYTMASIALLVARMAGDSSLSLSLEAKCNAMEALGMFAMSSRVDMRRMEPKMELIERMRISDIALDRYMEILKILAGLDHPDEWKPIPYPPGSSLEIIVRLVTAYNRLWGLGLEDARREILKGIYTTLRFPQPEKIDVESLKVQEDEYNEFKESLIYPANNNMRPDDRIQGREIMEVICGMLNHKGGTIYLGVNNQAIPVGLDADFRFLNNGSDRYDLRDIEDKFSLNFHWHLRNQIGKTYEGRPITDYVKLTFDIHDDKVTGRVSVEPFPGMVKMKDGQVYIRQDSSTLPLPPREQPLFMQRRIEEARS